MIKVKNYRSLTLILIAIIMASFMFGMLAETTVAYADDISDLEQKIKELSAKSTQIDGQLKDLGGKIEYEEQTQIVLKDKIVNTEAQIQLYGQKITAMDVSISEKEKEIELKLADIAVNETFFEDRVRSMYISSTSTSTLSYILSSKSFSELLTRTEIMSRISESDTELINNLKSEKSELDTIKQNMEQQNVELTATKANLSSSSDELDSLKANSEANEASLLKTQEKYLADKKATKSQIEQNDAEIDRILAARANKGQAPEGEYKWPVPSSSRITSPFGWRTWANGTKEHHNGVDIGAKSGADILAAQSGTVVMVKKVSYGYGHHLVIDHGGGHATLYAHTSSIDVSEGQTVERGQVIGGIGSTGASTGNHLHFEVRINGKKQNPINYVVKP